MSAPVTFKITVPHDPDAGFHHWCWIPNGWREEPAFQRRDRAGNLQGRRSGYFPQWFVLICNNTECPGRAVVPVSVVTDLADRADPEADPR